MLDTTHELTNETPINDVELTTRIKNALNAAGVKTVGEVREMSDRTLLSLPDFGQYSLSYCQKLGRGLLLSKCCPGRTGICQSIRTLSQTRSRVRCDNRTKAGSS